MYKKMHSINDTLLLFPGDFLELAWPWQAQTTEQWPPASQKPRVPHSRYVVLGLYPNEVAFI